MHIHKKLAREILGRKTTKVYLVEHDAARSLNMVEADDQSHEGE